MIVSSPSSLLWLLLVFSLSHFSPRADATGPGLSKSLKVQACGEALNQVMKLMCVSVYRRKRSLSAPSNMEEFGLVDPNSIATFSQSHSIEASDIEDLIALFGEDILLEDIRPLSFLLKENALFFDDSEPILPGGSPYSAHESRNPAGSPYFAVPRYLRLRRQNKGGIHHECCLNKCSYSTLKSYCGENRPGRGK